MGFPQKYNPAEAERRWQETWADNGTYEFNPDDPRPIFSIDTPPPTVSGEIHIGHVYSYVQAEAIIRFWRMQGYNVYYPFGFDDNGLPTERYVERRRGIRARDIGREAFITACLEVSREVEDRFEAFWKSLGFSADWRLRYSTIDENARRTSQWSFIDLFRKGKIYRDQAPNPWCIECQTAIAQAEMEDIERESTFYTLAFRVDQHQAAHGQQHQGDNLPSIINIATTRPELLPACVALFVHPDDTRYAHLLDGQAAVPLFGRQVPILADPTVDPEKGTGAVMCCTFGDTTDVAWWRTHRLPLIPLITRQGRLSDDGGLYAGLTLREARERIIADLHAAGQLLEQRPTRQSVRVHERCGTPLEILETGQWFIRVLDEKAALLEAGRKITWHPAHMHARYEHWVENLNWDWCISRQRYFGVPFPLWHCTICGKITLADESQLPIDPTTSSPPRACSCGSTELRPETDVMDTWATSSVSPQIAGQMLDNPELFRRLFPMQLRPQAHDIIRTWAFDTIVKSYFHFGEIPWQTLAVSGHALDPSGRKLSKSKNNAPTTPSALIERHNADAVRYWACGGNLGMDQLISEEMMRQGTRLITKLWNAAKFVAAQSEAAGWQVGTHEASHSAEFATSAQPLDRAMLSWLQRLIERATTSFQNYDYPAAKDATERFFWGTLCDNYLEMVKARLYDGTTEERMSALETLHATLLTLLKLFAPFMPHITEEIYQQLYARGDAFDSIHRSSWPVFDQQRVDAPAELAGDALMALATAARRFKSHQQLSLGAELARITIATTDDQLRTALAAAQIDLRSVTRARKVDLAAEVGEGFEEAATELFIRIER